MQIQAIKVQRLYLQVADQLLQLIRSGEVALGARLPSERDLASQFGVSRPTIREAMIALEIAGAVEIRSGSGVYALEQIHSITPSSQDQGPGPFEILEARLLIESDACALAAERISDAELSELEGLLAEMESENQQESATEQADARFHQCIAQAARNSAISATIGWLWDLRKQSEISTHFHQRLREDGIKPIIADHLAILNALKQRDPRAARSAMKNHLQRVIDSLMDSQ